MGKDAYYFSHDSNARTDTKIADMIFDYGMEGYGMYWVVIEVLRENEDFKLKNNKSTCRALAMQMHLTCIEKVAKFIDECINDYGLFAYDGEFFWSESLVRRMVKVEDVREKRRKAAQTRWNKGENNANAYNNDANAIQEQSNSNASVMQNYAKEKKRKEKKEKENNNIEQVWALYPKKKGKANAIKKIPKIINEIGLEKLIECIDNYKIDITNNGTEEKYILQGDTFFNGRYLDYMDKQIIKSKEIERERKYGF